MNKNIFIIAVFGLCLVSCNKPKDNELPTGNYNYSVLVPAISHQANDIANYDNIELVHVSRGHDYFILKHEGVPKETILEGTFNNSAISRAGACFSAVIEYGDYKDHKLELRDCHLVNGVNEYPEHPELAAGSGLVANYMIDGKITGHACFISGGNNPEKVDFLEDCNRMFK
jgi:hypothetical protein